MRTPEDQRVLLQGQEEHPAPPNNVPVRRRYDHDHAEYTAAQECISDMPGRRNHGKSPEPTSQEDIANGTGVEGASVRNSSTGSIDEPSDRHMAEPTSRNSIENADLSHDLNSESAGQWKRFDKNVDEIFNRFQSKHTAAEVCFPTTFHFGVV